MIVGTKREKYGKESLEFLCHAKNVTSGNEWLEAWGGRRGYESVLAFKLTELRLTGRR